MCEFCDEIKKYQEWILTSNLSAEQKEELSKWFESQRESYVDGCVRANGW